MKSKISRSLKKKILHDFVFENVNDIDSLSFRYGISRNTISDLIDRYVKENSFFRVVSSLLKDNVFFAFNGINEREFSIDTFGHVNEPYLFNNEEKRKLRYLGFII